MKVELVSTGGTAKLLRESGIEVKDVAVVTSPADYQSVAAEMEKSGGSLELATRWRLAQQAFALTAAYDSAIASTLERTDLPHGDEEPIISDSFPPILRLRFDKVADL